MWDITNGPVQSAEDVVIPDPLVINELQVNTILGNDNATPNFPNGMQIAGQSDSLTFYGETSFFNNSLVNATWIGGSRQTVITRIGDRIFVHQGGIPSCTMLVTTPTISYVTTMPDTNFTPNFTRYGLVQGSINGVWETMTVSYSPSGLLTYMRDPAGSQQFTIGDTVIIQFTMVTFPKT